MVVCAWGDNSFGQLGIERRSEDDIVTVPKIGNSFKDATYIKMCLILHGLYFGRKILSIYI